MADAGVSGTEMQRDLVPVDESQIGVLSCYPIDAKDNHDGCSSCSGNRTVLSKSTSRTEYVFGSKKKNRLARKAASIF